MTTQSQIVAVEQGIRKMSYAEFTELHRVLSKGQMLAGLSRTYLPKDDEGEQLPPEQTLVQIKADQIIDKAKGVLTRLFDVAATREWGNTRARASITVEGQELLPDVPVGYLLFLEKQLQDLHTFIGNLPTLDAAEHWTWDTHNGVWRSDPVQTVKTKKTPRNHVKYEATDKHPAQVDAYFEDVMVGTYTTVKTSGALPATRVDQLQERVKTLMKAVKYAREQANAIEVDDQRVGAIVLGWLFA